MKVNFFAYFVHITSSTVNNAYAPTSWLRRPPSAAVDGLTASAIHAMNRAQRPGSFGCCARSRRGRRRSRRRKFPSRGSGQDGHLFSCGRSPADRASPSELRFQPIRQPATHSGYQHLGFSETLSAVAPVHDGKGGAPVGESFDMFQGLGQRMAVVWIAGHGAHPYQPLPDRRMFTFAERG